EYPRTAPSKGMLLNVRSAATKAYVAHLRAQQERHLDEISAHLGRMPLVTHHYVFNRSGMAMQLDAFEAEWVEALIGEGSVEADVDVEPSTYRGPSFIGADRVWGLPIGPPGTGAGRGTVIGLLDSGIGTDHVSFANDPDCGFNAVSPKLRSARDC